MATGLRRLSSTESFLLAAKAAGLPRDSVERFLAAGYVPQPKQLQFHAACRSTDDSNGPTEIGFGGARGPGKTTASFAQVAIDDCQRVPDLKCLFLRRVAKAAKESITDLRKKLLRHIPHKYNGSSGIIEFNNGSRIIIGHFNHDKDIDAYLGLEYDLIAIEEDTQLSAQKKKDIATCLRTSKTNWRPRRYRTTNPGGIDHGGFKSEFIIPWRQGNETYTRFIPATVYDNVLVNPEYRQQLERLTGWQRKAWLEGDWDIAAGQFFTTWRHDVHVKALDPLPAHWTVWAAMDYGFTHPTVVYLLAKFDGKIYFVDEYYAARRLPKQNAEGIKEMLSRNSVPLCRLTAFVAGEDVFSQKGDSEGKTIADQYESHGITLEHAVIDRISGAAEFLDLLGDVDSNPAIEPKVVISPRCVRLIECLPRLQHDPRRPEDVLKVDVDVDGNGGDDPYDGGRYGIMFDPQSPQAPIAGGERKQLSAYSHR